jgi:MFS family permease
MLKSVWRDTEIWALAVAETIVWAGIYYIFAALMSQWERDLGWSKSELAIGFTSCLMVSGLIAPLIGSFIDKGFGRKVLIGGAVFGGILLLLMVFMNALWQFYTIWTLLGIAAACCFYEPCFAYITHTRPANAKAAITLVTLVAGFAGTFAFPTANMLAEWYSWRVAVSFFSAMILLVAVPLFYFSTRSASRAQSSLSSTESNRHSLERKLALREAITGAHFWIVTVSFGLIMINHNSLLTHFLPMMDERGISLEMAVFAAAMIGPMQVVGRIAMVLTEQWLSALVTCCVSFSCLIVSSLCLIYSVESPGLIFGFVIFQGVGIGVFSIMRPVIIAELFGMRGFGAISGVSASVGQMSMALAPTLAAAIWLLGGYDIVLLSMLAIAVVATLMFGAVALTQRRAA